MSTKSILSFSGGELAPSLHARVDTAKYQTGLRTMENFVAMKHGGAVRRPGLEHVARCHNDYKMTRLIPFRDTDENSFILEIGDYYMRILDEGTYFAGRSTRGVFNAEHGTRSPGTGTARSADTITGISSDLTVTVDATGSGFVYKPKSIWFDGDEVLITGVTGVNNVNGRKFIVKSANAAAGTMRLQTMSGEYMTASGTYVSGGEVNKILIMRTPWSSGTTHATSDVFKIRYTQSHGKMYLTAEGYPIMLIERSLAGKWSIGRFNAGSSGTPTVSATSYYQYTNSGLWSATPTYNIRSWADRPESQKSLTAPLASEITFYRSVVPQGWLSANPRTVEEDHRRYAVSVVDVDGNESLPMYSDYIVRLDPAVDVVDATGLHTAGASNAALITSTGSTYTWESPNGLAHRIAVGRLAQTAKCTIIGADWSGRGISETINGSEFEITGNDARITSAAYFKAIYKIVTDASISATDSNWAISVIILEDDWENNKVSWDAPDTPPVTGTRYTYRVYRSSGGRFGLVGETENTYFHDYNVVPDYAELPLSQYDPFDIKPPAGIKDFDSVMYNPALSRISDFDVVPHAVGQYQQRLVFGRSNKHAERLWCSSTGEYNNFNPREILKDSGSFFFTLAGQSRGAIQHMLTLGKLVVFTDSGEWVVSGSDSGALTPTQVNAKQIGFYGTGRLNPLMVGQDVVFFQPRGCIVRDLGWNMQGSGYSGSDLTVFAGHLFRRKELADWDYQQNPESLIWACTTDGDLLGMSYLKEHQIVAWHRHYVGGSQEWDGTRAIVESIACVPEGTGRTRRDAVYMVVKRYIDGEYVRSVERMSDFYEPTYLNYKLCDSYYQFNGWLDEDTPEDARSTTMTVSEYDSGGYDSDATVTVTASAAYFGAVVAGDELHFGDAGDVDLKVTVSSVSSTTVLTGAVDRDVPSALQATATAEWGYAPSVISGLYHLVGEDVAIVGDGAVLASPFNDDYDTATVSGATAAVTIPDPSCIVVVGLPYSSNLETLTVDTVDGESLADKQKLVPTVTAHLEDSKGGFYGADPGVADSLTGLYEMNYNSVQGYVDTNDLFTGLNTIAIESDWGDGGRVYIRQVDPLPMSVLSLHPQINATKRGR